MNCHNIVVFHRSMIQLWQEEAPVDSKPFDAGNRKLPVVASSL
jgi:hypothetical protein